MKLNKIIDIIENKLFESKMLFPDTLGSGTNKKLGENSIAFRANLSMAMQNLREIQKIINKK